MKYRMIEGHDYKLKVLHLIPNALIASQIWERRSGVFWCVKNILSEMINSKNILNQS